MSVPIGLSYNKFTLVKVKFKYFKDEILKRNIFLNIKVAKTDFKKRNRN